jgi:glucose-6-phosphate isomerase, archaeal
MNGQASRKFDPGIGVHFDRSRFTFTYEPDVFGPEKAELRRLDEIRSTLHDPKAQGPDPVYAIAMDVGRTEHREVLKRRNLLYGVVAYASGQIGCEPVRSQGHVHAIAPHCGWSTPELVEVWSGKAIVYMQQCVARDPKACIAVEASVGDVVVIPPAWAHYIVNADSGSEMVFGAFCDRQYAFVYDEIRRRGGLAWFPKFAGNGEVQWEPNSRYEAQGVIVRRAREYPELGLLLGSSIYEQFVRKPEAMQWVSEPAIYADLWETFES